MNEDSYRQVYRWQAPMDVNPISKEIVQLILKREKDGRLKWSKEGHVQVLIDKILPEDLAPKQTLMGRRNRLSSAIKHQLIKEGWKAMGNLRFEPPVTS